MNALPSRSSNPAPSPGALAISEASSSASARATDLLGRISFLNEDELRLELSNILAQQKLGLVWEHSAIARDKALNADVVLPVANAHVSCIPTGASASSNLIIEGDNFDSLRMLRSTHTGKVRVIFIDPPYNTGNKDWVYQNAREAPAFMPGRQSACSASCTSVFLP